MNVKRLLGLDIRAADYAYVTDPVMGHTSARKIPDRWVRTTCGYCSVGCGMFIGVKQGRAVSVRGDADHPVNAGALCPKGLSEHETIGAADRLVGPDRAVDPAGKQSGGALAPVEACGDRHSAPRSRVISSTGRWMPVRMGVSRIVERRLSVPRSSRTSSPNAGRSSVS